MKKFLFLLLTFFLVTVVATVLSVMKPGDKVPDVSNAILLVTAAYLALYLVYKAISKVYGFLQKNHPVSQRVNSSIEEKGELNRVSPKKKALQTVVMIVGTILFVYLVLGAVGNLFPDGDPQREVVRQKLLSSPTPTSTSTKSVDTDLEIEKCKVESQNASIFEENERFTEVVNEMVRSGVNLPNEQIRQMFKDNEKDYRNRVYEDCLNKI